MNTEQPSFYKCSEPWIFRGVERKALPGQNIAISVGFKVDAKRMFNALVGPEYREIWLCLPGQDESISTVATQISDYYRLEFCRFGHPELVITGLYHTCRRRKLQFTWQRFARSGTTLSFVDIRLEGDFGNTVLHLNHFGIRSRKEYLWHERMWQASLQKLRHLF